VSAGAAAAPENTRREGGAAPRIRLRGLVKRFGSRRALDGVNLELAGAQIVGVVGPDGAGKTTLLRCVAGLLEVEADEASVLTFDLRRDVRDLKARIGYVPQVFSLQPELSVFENLAFTARLHGLSRAERDRRAGALLERTALAPFAGRRAGDLSGGMKQKLAVANALLPEPSLLVLDEPTAGVDVTARAEIWALLEHARDAGSLVLLGTSYLDEAAGCAHLVYLDAGRVLASGTPAELRRRVGLELYRVWCDAPRELTAAARSLPFVVDARPSGGSVRVELRAEASPGAAAVLAALLALPGARLAEALPTDMEATLLALARAGAEAQSRR
jgi:ABC-type multidrug transport system ATPase subunit